MRSSIRLNRLGACAALALVAIAVAGCGETVIDSGKTQEALKANFEKSLHSKVSSVSCPSEQKVEPNATFTCAVSFSDGSQVTATLKIINKEADLSVIGCTPISRCQLNKLRANK